MTQKRVEISTTGPESDDLLDLRKEFFRRITSKGASEFSLPELNKKFDLEMRRIPERERLILSLSVYEGMTPREIGSLLAMPEFKVQDLHNRAMKRLARRMSR